jgi:hypothetical protein
LTNRSGLSADFFTARLMAMEWPSFSVSFTMNVKIIKFCPSPSSASRILVVTHILDTEYKVMDRNI